MEPKGYHVHNSPHHLPYLELRKNKQYQNADVGNTEFPRGMLHTITGCQFCSSCGVLNKTLWSGKRESLSALSRKSGV